MKNHPTNPKGRKGRCAVSSVEVPRRSVDPALGILPQAPEGCAPTGWSHPYSETKPKARRGCRGGKGRRGARSANRNALVAHSIVQAREELRGEVDALVHRVEEIVETADSTISGHTSVNHLSDSASVVGTERAGSVGPSTSEIPAEQISPEEKERAMQVIIDDIAEELEAELKITMKGVIRKADFTQTSNAYARRILQTILEKKEMDLPATRRLALLNRATLSVVGLTEGEVQMREAFGGKGKWRPAQPKEVRAWLEANDLASGEILYKRKRTMKEKVLSLGTVCLYDKVRGSKTITSCIGPHLMRVAQLPK